MENITSANHNEMLQSFEKMATLMGDDLELQTKAKALAEQIEKYENEQIHFAINKNPTTH
jgi:hypothetical protein